MSHELRTPLNAIIGLTEMMVKNVARFGAEKAQEPLQRVNRAGNHLLGLINQVLDLSKIEAGKLELNPQTVQLAPLINEVISTAGQPAEQNKKCLVVDAQDNLGAWTPRGCGRYCSIFSATRASSPKRRISCRHRSHKGRADQLFLYLASFCSSHLRPSGLAIQRSAVSLVLCKVGCLSDSR